MNEGTGSRQQGTGPGGLRLSGSSLLYGTPMPLPAFRERPEEFTHDLHRALPRGDRAIDGAWLNLPLVKRLEILRRLPPDERFMFTLRDACLFEDVLEESVMKALFKNGNPRLSIEYLCNGAGFVAERGGIQNLRLVCHCREHVRRDMHLIVDRVTQQKKSAGSRVEQITDRLFQLKRKKKYRSRDWERDVGFRRRVFNVRLMQALAHEDVTSVHMKHMGMNPNSAVTLMKKHQGSEYRSISVVNDALHFLPVEPTGKTLALDFFRSRLSPAARLSKIRPDLVERELDGRAKGERHSCATVVMALRAMGIEDIDGILDQDIEDEYSDLRRRFRLLLRESHAHRRMKPVLFLSRLQECVELLRPLIVSSRLPLLGRKRRNGWASPDVKNPVQ